MMCSPLTKYFKLNYFYIHTYYLKIYSLERQDCKRNLFNVSLFDIGVGKKIAWKQEAVEEQLFQLQTLVLLKCSPLFVQ